MLCYPRAHSRYPMKMRQDICFVVNTLSQFLTDPRHVHLIATKHILRYLRGTVDYGLKYEVNQKINLEVYVDSYWACNAIDRKSTSGCCFSMRSGVISWFSKKEPCMVLRKAERGTVKLQFVIQIKISQKREF